MSEQARYWAGLVASWQTSGVSQTEFCRRRGVNAGPVHSRRGHMWVYISTIIPPTAPTN